MTSNVPKSNWPKTWSVWNSLGKTVWRPLLIFTICGSLTIPTNPSQKLLAQSLLRGSANSQDLKEDLQNLPSCELLDKLQLSMNTSLILKLLKPEMPRKLSILLCRMNSELSRPSLSDEDKND